MRYFHLMIAVVALVGCGGGKDSNTAKITDIRLEKALSEEFPFAVSNAEILYTDQVRTTQELELNQMGIKSIEGIQVFRNLEHLWLEGNQLTDVTALEKLTQLTYLSLHNNKLTDVKGLENFTKLEYLELGNNPDLTKAQIAELQKALPKCEIYSNPTK